MLFTSFSQVIALVVLFFAGLVLGFGLHPGGKKWRQRFKDESENYARFRRDADKRLREAKLRIAELERGNAALRDRDAAVDQLPDAARTRSIPADVVTTTDGTRKAISDSPAPATSVFLPIAAAAAVPAFFYPREPEPELTGDATPMAHPAPATPATDPVKDKAHDGSVSLTRIRGIDAPLSMRLVDLGVARYEDVTELSAVDEMALEQRLALPAGYIAGEQWREQAALLRDGRDAEQAERFPSR